MSSVASVSGNVPAVQSSLRKMSANDSVRHPRTSKKAVVAGGSECANYATGLPRDLATGHRPPISKGEDGVLSPATTRGWTSCYGDSGAGEVGLATPRFHNFLSPKTPSERHPKRTQRQRSDSASENG